MRTAIFNLWRRGRRLIALALAAAGGLVLLAHPPAWADVLSNIGPASQVPGGSLMDAYPLGHYGLDHHFSAVDAGLLSGIDVSGIAPTIAWFLTNVIWQLTAFIAYAVITLFTFAFSLDLLGGSGTGGGGALAPVGEAIRSIYRTAFGEPWLVVAITLAGLWAIWNALVRRRYTETAGALAVSVVFIVIALVFVTQPERTIGQASKWTNAMSGAFLSISSEGDVTSRGEAKRSAADRLFGLLVYEPWVVLQFGGREHCTRTGGGDPASVKVRPLSRNPGRDMQLSRQLARGDQVQADGKVCVNAAHKYAPQFLKYPPGSDEREAHYKALTEGDAGKAPAADRDGYRLSDADKPAAEAMGKDGQYQRLLLAIVIFGVELGAFILIAALSVAVILAQVLVLVLLAFAPVALVIGVFPGRGHDFFKGWLAKLGAFLLRKAIYSLILAVLLTVVAAVQVSTSNLGWLMSWGLQGAFFWTVLIWRKQLLGQLTLATVGRGGQDSGAGRMVSVYAFAHLANRIGRQHFRRPTRTPDGTGGRRQHAPPTASETGPPGPEQPPAAGAMGSRPGSASVVPAAGGAGTAASAEHRAQSAAVSPANASVERNPQSTAGPASGTRQSADPGTPGGVLDGPSSVPNLPDPVSQGESARPNAPGAGTPAQGTGNIPAETRHADRESPLARGLREDRERLANRPPGHEDQERPQPPAPAPLKDDPPRDSEEPRRQATGGQEPPSRPGRPGGEAS